MGKPFLRNLSEIELERWIVSSGEKAFRAKQIHEWIWRKGAKSIDQMTNIPEQLRKRLADQFQWDRILLQYVQKASDKTTKAAFVLTDNNIIEGVIIPSESRVTACVSTQVGCPVKCTFCATGQLGLKRNLSAGEIFDQVVDLNALSIHEFNKKLTNIVVMGMGEPFLNYENTINALKRVCSKDGLGWSSQRITISTVGIPDAIKKLADENLGIELALSLHSAIQQKREQLIPFAKKYTLDDLLDALRYYTKNTQQRITFEYLMLKGINDQKEDAKALIKLASMVNVKINLIHYNDVDGSVFSSTDDEQLTIFKNLLIEKNVLVKIRQSRGMDIDAACGQLANKIIKM